VAALPARHAGTTQYRGPRKTSHVSCNRTSSEWSHSHPGTLVLYPVSRSQENFSCNRTSSGRTPISHPGTLALPSIAVTPGKLLMYSDLEWSHSHPSLRHAGTTQYRGPRKTSHVIGPRVVALPARHAGTTQYRGPRKTSHVIGPRVVALPSRRAGTTQLPSTAVPGKQLEEKHQCACCRVA
jgi:hypothetical protein